LFVFVCFFVAFVTQCVATHTALQCRALLASVVELLIDSSNISEDTNYWS